MIIRTTWRAVRCVRIGFFCVLLGFFPTLLVLRAVAPSPPALHVLAEAPPRSSPPSPGPARPEALWQLHDRLSAFHEWVAAVALNERRAQVAAAAAARIAKIEKPIPRPVPRPVVVPAVAAPVSLQQVMQCIKDHESGDYTRNSHGYSGASGAYQIVRSTWLPWSGRSGHPGYDAAFLAPPSVQDAVVIYMLTNGGAGNWSTRYGNDPCTAGLT